jgi:N-carbamoyl-L-amino-acid hydrolase
MTVNINAERLWARHIDLAGIGATAGGGVCRLALDESDLAAHRQLADIGASLGMSLFIDEVGNMFMRRPGSDDTLPPVVAGSHIDTQPSGGRFDGVFGVLAALEAIEAIAETGIVTRHPLECVVWNNEEGSRFAPGCMGSAVYAGVMPLELALATRDDHGVALREVVPNLRRRLPEALQRPLGTAFAALVEAHIEQGPELEAGNETIGIVTGMQGNLRLIVEVRGREDHSGTTPRRRRKDAFFGAVAIVEGLRARLEDADDILRFTIGRFQVQPNAWSVVPGQAIFSIDLRHPNQEVLDRCLRIVEEVASAQASPCTASVRRVSGAPPVLFDGAVREAIRHSAQRRGFAHRDIYSGAGHDSRYFPALCPTGMLFIPCRDGISHNEAEYASPAHVAAGAQVLADAMLDLAR